MGIDDRNIDKEDLRTENPVLLRSINSSSRSQTVTLCCGGYGQQVKAGAATNVAMYTVSSYQPSII
jgi:hypothetical protein